jgi:plasmid stability protein
MSTRKLTVALPDGLLARIRDRARQANHAVEAEILDLLAAAVPADPTPSTDLTKATPAAGKRPRTRRTERTDANGQRAGGRAGSAARPKTAGSPDEEALPPDIAEEVSRVETLGTDGLLKAAKPAMSPRQTKRLADLNRKAQDEGLTDAEEKERDELLHLYEKAMVVRATALAELRKRGVDVSDLIAP